jgi:hypothetical protein
MLTGWKSIAQYLDVSIRTAKNWHYYMGMPVNRDENDRVWAEKAVLKAWRFGKCVQMPKPLA